MTLYEKKILQIPTANFANSEINGQVPSVSLKAELTVHGKLDKNTRPYRLFSV